MPVAWDETKERQLLLTVIHVVNPGALNWNRIAELMNAQGGGSDYVGNALRQKYAKMKKVAEDQYGTMLAGENDGASPKTPAKRGTAKKVYIETPAKSTGKWKPKKIVSEEAKDEEDDEDLGSPSKKVKAEPVEDDDENDFLL